MAVVSIHGFSVVSFVGSSTHATDGDSVVFVVSSTHSSSSSPLDLSLSTQPDKSSSLVAAVSSGLNTLLFVGSLPNNSLSLSLLLL